MATKRKTVEKPEIEVLPAPVTSLALVKMVNDVNQEEQELEDGIVFLIEKIVAIQSEIAVNSTEMEALNKRSQAARADIVSVIYELGRYCYRSIPLTEIGFAEPNNDHWHPYGSSLNQHDSGARDYPTKDVFTKNNAPKPYVLAKNMLFVLHQFWLGQLSYYSPRGPTSDLKKCERVAAAMKRAMQEGRKKEIR